MVVLIGIGIGQAFKFLFICVYGYFACVYISVPHAYLMPKRAPKKCPVIIVTDSCELSYGCSRTASALNVV